MTRCPSVCYPNMTLHDKIKHMLDSGITYPDNARLDGNVHGRFHSNRIAELQIEHRQNQ